VLLVTIALHPGFAQDFLLRFFDLPQKVLLPIAFPELFFGFHLSKA
jgi:hypothetical protein